MEIARVEGMIQANLKEIGDTREGMKIADALMLQHYDNFLQTLYEKDAGLKERKKLAIRFWQEQMAILQELEKAVKVLEKHKEKKREEYKEEQRRIEIKQLNEVGSQRHFAKTRENEQEEQEYLEELRNLGIDINEQDGF